MADDSRERVTLSLATALGVALLAAAVIAVRPATGSADHGGQRVVGSVVAPVDLGTLGGNRSTAYAVSPSGQVVGESEVGDGTSHAFSWARQGGMVDIGPAGVWSTAWAVSPSGQVVGSIKTQGPHHSPQLPFSWTRQQGLVVLPTLGATAGADAVSANGLVVGGCSTPAGYAHACVWTRAGELIDLGTFGGTMSSAAAVSPSGEVVGSSDTSDGNAHAFAWTKKGGMIDLGTLGGPMSFARAVNARGEVAGISATAAGELHVFRWTRARGMEDLGTLNAASVTEVVAISDSGRIAGTSGRAFLWTPKGGMVDLGALTPGGSSYAVDITPSAQVVGNSDGFGFSWIERTGMTKLADLGGGRSDAYAANPSGLVVGKAFTASGDNHAVFWATNGRQ